MADRGLFDMHCHIVPAVDDGAQSVKEAFAMLQMEYDQGVRKIIVTPHFRREMFETPSEIIKKHFLVLRRLAEKIGPDFKVFLGCEFHANVEMLDYLAGDEAGVKSVTLQINGHNAYGFFRSEKGVHRLVRISPFDANARRHTSFSAVDVMPELDDTVNVDINMEDVRVDLYRASGAGGQHVNKTSSAVRMTHIPTGIVVQCQNERSQLQNKEKALQLLRGKLYAFEKAKQDAKISDLAGDYQAIEWGSQIRSYVFQPYTMVKDHRTSYETANVDGVMDGDLRSFVEAYLRQEYENKRLAAKQI